MDESRDDRLGLTFDDRPSSKLRMCVCGYAVTRGEGSKDPRIERMLLMKPRGGCQRSVEKDSRQKTVFSARTVYLGIIPLRVRSYTISQGSRCNVCIYIYIHKCALECVRVYASISLSLSLYLSIYLSIYLSFRLFIHLLYVCVNGYPCV